MWCRCCTVRVKNENQNEHNNHFVAGHTESPSIGDNLPSSNTNCSPKMVVRVANPKRNGLPHRISCRKKSVDWIVISSTPPASNCGLRPRPGDALHRWLFVCAFSPTIIQKHTESINQLNVGDWKVATTALSFKRNPPSKMGSHCKIQMCDCLQSQSARIFRKA